MPRKSLVNSACHSKKKKKKWGGGGGGGEAMYTSICALSSQDTSSRFGANQYLLILLNAARRNSKYQLYSQWFDLSRATTLAVKAGETANINYIASGLTCPELECTTYYT